MTGFMDLDKTEEPGIKEENCQLAVPKRKDKERKPKILKLNSSGKSGNDRKEENIDENFSEGRHVNTLVASFQELDEKIKSLMEKGDPSENPSTCFCKVCGQRGATQSLKDHIEAKHLEGISLPCNICEKVFKSRVSLRMHKSRTHKV